MGDEFELIITSKNNSMKPIKLEVPVSLLVKLQGKSIDNNPITDEIISKVSDLEVDLIKKVVEIYLGRKPDEEDFKKVQRTFYRNNVDKYILGFDGFNLGMIKYNVQGYA